MTEGEDKVEEMTRADKIALLVEGAVLTRMFCAELENGRGKRVDLAVYLLFRWAETHGHSNPRNLAYALKAMVAESDCLNILEELSDGVDVCECYELMLSADSPWEADKDRARLEERLASYWRKHKSPAIAPWR